MGKCGFNCRSENPELRPINHYQQNQARLSDRRSPFTSKVVNWRPFRLIVFVLHISF
jgi:hypothetical protein